MASSVLRRLRCGSWSLLLAFAGGCTSDVAAGPVCGDGTVEGARRCDAGIPPSADGCSGSCEVEGGVCGDRIVNTGEACDDGNTAPGDGCSATCGQESACGDGIVDAGEVCDDENNAAGDGCDEVCQAEGSPSPGSVSVGSEVVLFDSASNQGCGFLPFPDASILPVSFPDTDGVQIQFATVDLRGNNYWIKGHLNPDGYIASLSVDCPAIMASARTPAVDLLEMSLREVPAGGELG